MIPLEPHPKPKDDVFTDGELLYRSTSDVAIVKVGNKETVLNIAVPFPNWSTHRSKYSDPPDVLIKELRPDDDVVVALCLSAIPGPFEPISKDGKRLELYVEHAPLISRDPPLDLYAHSELRITRCGLRDAKYKPGSKVFEKDIRDKVADQLHVVYRRGQPFDVGSTRPV